VLVLLYTLSWLIGVAMTVYVLAAFAFLTYVRRRTMSVWKQNREMSATFYGFIEERLRGTEDIRANGATGYILRRFSGLARRWWPITLRPPRCQTGSAPASRVGETGEICVCHSR